jgi:hypothetical protein
MSVGGTAVSLDGHTHSYLPLSGGTLTGTLTSRAITPNADNTHDLGASGARWQDIYAVNLHVGTIVGTPSYSHSHAASDITSGTLDFARIPTTWTGALTLDADSAGTSNYVRWLTQTSTGKAWDLIGRAHDFATAAQQNDMLLTYYDGTTTHIVFQADNTTRIVDFGQTPTVGGTAVSLSGHTHDDRYFTEAESDARYVQTATLSNYLLASGATTGATSQAQTFTNGVRTGNGTALVPAFSFSASDSTGIYRQAVDSLSIATVGTERLRVNASGQISINGAPITGYVVTAQPATGQTGGMTLEGTYASAGFLFNTSAILRHAAGATMQAMRWVPTEEPQGAITTFININNNLRLDNSAFNVTNVRLAQGQLLSQAGYTGAITSLSMFHALNASLGGATLTNQYGYYCAALSGATNNYAFYAAGTTPSFFGGTIYADSDVEISGELLAANGSASLPSIAALSDTNTGLYWSAADVLSVTTGGVLRASFNSAGATVVGALTVPTINTASGTLTIAPANSTTSVSGALSLTGTLSSTSWNITSAGAATVVTATASTSVTAPTVTTASGNLTLTSTGGTVAVTGALTGSSTAAFVTSVSSPIITNAGALTVSPTGNITLTPGGNVTLVSTATMGSDNYASRTTGWRIDGAGGGDFRYLYTDELHAKSFIADLEQALAGSQIISKSVAVLAEDFVAPYAGATQLLPVEDLPSAANMAAFQANDIVLLRSFSRAGGALTIGNCWGAVTSYTDGAGTQTWTFTRSGATTYNAIAARGTATSSTSSAATSRSVTKPTGVVSGDVMIAVVTYDGSADVVTASGWTELGSATGSDITAHVLYRVAGGSEGASYTFSVVNSHAIGASITAYYNVDTTTPIDNYSIQANAAGASMPAPAAWATSTAGRLVFLGGVSNSTTVTPPSGATELVDAGSTGIRVYVADEVLTTSGNHSKTATIASSSFASVAATVILRPTYVSMTSEAGAMTPGTTVSAKSLVLDYGVSGNGFVETTAVDGAYGANSPYQQTVSWATHPATGQTVRTRTGNLYGLFAQANEYGFYAGSGVTTADNYIRLSSYTSAFNNVPISIYSSGAKIVGIDTTRGLDIEIDTTDNDSNRAISFRSSGTTYSWIKSYNTLGWQYIKMAAEPIAGLNNAVVLRTKAAASKESSISINTTNAAGTVSGNYIYMQHKTDDTGAMEFYSAAFTMLGPLTLSNAVGTQLTVNGSSVFNGNIGTSWAGLSFGSGWGNYGGGYYNGHYKKVGDLVFLRGLVARSSGSGTTIATLPSGFRPSSRSLFGVLTSALSGSDRVDVDSNGDIILVSGGVGYVQLDGLVFSTI